MIQTESSSIETFIENLTVGEPTEYKNVKVYPLTLNRKRKTKYLSMQDAMKLGLLEMTEKSAEGTVNEIKVTNKGPERVLLLDGEEIAGAKQNRIFNATILLKKQSESVIPVSCTEMGRWNYRSEKFSNANAIATPKLRKRKMKSVHHSLRASKVFKSDQREVWNSVNEVLSTHHMSSPTRAMNEAFKKTKRDKKDYLSHFKPTGKQQGVIVVIDGKIRGLDYLSSKKAFRKVYKKLLHGYVMEAGGFTAGTKESKSRVQPENPATFLSGLLEAKKEKFKSPGHGYDWRLNNEAITASALLYRGEVIHFSAFIDKDSPEDKITRRPWFIF